jgi:uncharacterized protein
MQSLSVITLGVKSLAAARRFYADGFGWSPVFENQEIVFWQMNGFVFGTWLEEALSKDLGRPPTGAGNVSLGHNVRTQAEVEPLMERLVAHGGRVLTPAKAPPFGGWHGHVADPDGHAWEICFNPAFPIAEDGSVRFGV